MLTAGGRLTLYNIRYGLKQETETNIVNGSITLSEKRITVSSGNTLVAYNRQGVEELYRINLGGRETARAKEKIFVAGSYGFTAINGYTGNMIWQDRAAAIDSAIAGECIYSLSAEGKISCYNGPDNLYPPVIHIRTSPAAAEGDHGYFITQPRVFPEPLDAETYAAATWYKLDGGEWEEYWHHLTLEDGQHTLVVYSKDSTGYREQDKDYCKIMSSRTIWQNVINRCDFLFLAAGLVVRSAHCPPMRPGLDTTLLKGI